MPRSNPPPPPGPRRHSPESLTRAVDDLDLPTLQRTSELWRSEQRGQGRIRRRWRVRMRCAACQREKTYFVENLLRGLSTQCACLALPKHQTYRDLDAATVRRIGCRYDAIEQRCTNPNYEWYASYGARGIEVHFADRESFVRYVLAHLPHPTYRDVQIDRIDNDGPYAPGNLRLVPQAVNLRNKQTSRLVDYRGVRVNATDLWHLMKTDMPAITIGPHRTAKLAAAGVPWPEIARRPGRGPRTPGTTWQPNPAIVALYRGG